MGVPSFVFGIVADRVFSRLADHPKVREFGRDVSRGVRTKVRDGARWVADLMEELEEKDKEAKPASGASAPESGAGASSSSPPAGN